jgi:hypothetical protein
LPNFIYGVQEASQKYKNMFNFFYFNIYLLAKFGEIFLWMIAILTIIQNCQKENTAKKCFCFGGWGISQYGDEKKN